MKKKEKKWFQLASVILMIFLCIPVLQAQFRLFPETTLKGVIEWTKKPILTWNSWVDGSFQNDFASWFEERIGFKAALVKTDNQINYSLFKEISASTETEVILGKNNFLYEKAYIDVWNGKNAVDKQFIKKQLRDLELLSQKLAY